MNFYSASKVELQGTSLVSLKMQIRHTRIYTNRNKEHSQRIPLSHRVAILILPYFIIQNFIYSEHIHLEIKIISGLGRLKARCSLTDLLSNSLKVKIQKTTRNLNLLKDFEMQRREGGGKDSEKQSGKLGYSEWGIKLLTFPISEEHNKARPRTAKISKGQYLIPPTWLQVWLQPE